MRAIIFANGKFTPPVQITPEDIVIAADGGGRHCLSQGVYPAYVIGDLDSLDGADLEALRSHGAQVIQYPQRKDYTDLELALRFAQSLPVNQVIILAALGERWDQTIANLLMPAAEWLEEKPLDIRLVDGSQELFLIRGGETARFFGRPGDTVSLIPLSGEAHNINTENLEYPLVHGTIRFGSTLGVSNVMLAEEASVSLGQGLLLCTIIHH